MEKMLNLSRINTLLERKDPMTITFVKRSTGEIVIARDVFVTSVYQEEGTCNLLFPGGEKRTIRTCLILRINHVKIYF